MHGSPKLRLRAALISAVVGCVVVVSACSSTTSSTTSGSGSSATSAPAAVPVNYAKQGPYKVGTTTLTLGDREVAVFYPSDAAGIAGATPVKSYNSGDAFTPELKQVVAGLVPEFVQEIPLDAYKDAKIAKDGPFPVIIHSHGFGGWNRFASQHLAHLASWGLVAAAPDHKSRDLGAVASSKMGQGPTDVEDLAATLTELTKQNATGGAALDRGLNFDLLGVEGHSAGGSAAVRWAAKEARVKTIIGQAPAPPVEFTEADRSLPAEEQRAKAKAQLAQLTPPAKPVLILAGAKDSVIPLPGVQSEFEWLKVPKAMEVLNAGHNSFTDTCKPILAAGGLEKYATVLPAGFAPLLKLGSDGCNPGDSDAQAVYDLINHSSVAWYRYVFGLDTSDVSLQTPYLQATFPTAFASMTWCWSACPPAAGTTSTSVAP